MSQGKSSPRRQKAALLAAYEDARDRFHQTLKRVSLGAYERPGAAGEWSLADVLAHLGHWHTLGVKGLTLIGQGRSGSRPFQIGMDTDTWNAKMLETLGPRTAHEAMRELRALEEQLSTAVQRISAEALADDPEALRHLYRVMVAHYQEHQPDVERAASEE